MFKLNLTKALEIQDTMPDPYLHDLYRRKGLVQAVHELVGTPNVGGSNIWWVKNG